MKNEVDLFGLMHCVCVCVCLLECNSRLRISLRQQQQHLENLVWILGSAAFLLHKHTHTHRSVRYQQINVYTLRGRIHSQHLFMMCRWACTHAHIYEFSHKNVTREEEGKKTLVHSYCPFVEISRNCIHKIGLYIQLVFPSLAVYLRSENDAKCRLYAENKYIGEFIICAPICLPQSNEHWV